MENSSEGQKNGKYGYLLNEVKHDYLFVNYGRKDRIVIENRGCLQKSR